MKILKGSQILFAVEYSVFGALFDLCSKPYKVNQCSDHSHVVVVIHIYKYFGKLIQFLRLCPLQTNESAPPPAIHTQVRDKDDDANDDEVVGNFSHPE